MGSLSEIQQQLILGCVLGDGYLRKKTNAHLQITHSVKQKEYVDWKYQILKDIVITPPKTYRGNADRIGYRFFTRSIPELTVFYGRFYLKSYPPYHYLSGIWTMVQKHIEAVILIASNLT